MAETTEKQMLSGNIRKNKKEHGESMNISARLQRVERITKQMQNFKDDPESTCTCKKTRFHINITEYTEEENKMLFNGDNPEYCPKCGKKYISVEFDENALEKEWRLHDDK